MKMTFLFKVEGIEFNNTIRSEYSNSSTSCSLESFEYNVGMESKPGELNEIYEGIAKMLPQIIEGVKSAMKTSTTSDQTSETNPTSAEEPVGDMDTDNLDPDRFKEV